MVAFPIEALDQRSLFRIHEVDASPFFAISKIQRYSFITLTILLLFIFT
jgi:hypothetical protein